MLTDKSLEEKAELFKCIGDPSCLKIISALIKNKELCVSEITADVGISMPAVSHQLSKLKSMGLVTRKRNGQMICYSLVKNDLTKVLKSMLNS
ncbi:helix-turn-helix transcriptional regulator [Candidatus Daviesbacteria bacterium]|nr:helix-turn-helix transcriptional regulator [Candidatus Daviesbacteria bacterium]